MHGLYDFITHPLLWICVGFLIVRFSYDWMFGSTCPACHKRRARETTGRHEPAGFMKSAESEYECKYCGHTFWDVD
jgi:transposase-like protein